MLPTDANAGPPLRRQQLSSDPAEQFRRWFLNAKENEPVFPEAMTLATVQRDGRPTARVVLMKEFDDRGFVFYTNYDSRKGDELESLPVGALVFWWRSVQRQVRVEGEIEKVSPSESDQYFASRPRGSQLSAWASRQSTVVVKRDMLEEQMQIFEKKFRGAEVPRPDHWGGYRLIPARWEFWQGRADRLHDRFEYIRDQDGAWVSRRLAP